MKYKEKTVLICEYDEIMFGPGEYSYKLSDLYNERLEAYKNSINSRIYPRSAIAFDNSSPEKEFVPFTASFGAKVCCDDEDKISVFITKRYNYSQDADRVLAESININKKNGERLRLSELVGKEDMRQRCVSEVLKSVSDEIKQGNDGYLYDWRMRADKFFNPEQFFIDKDKTVIFYQQYNLTYYERGISFFELK